MSKMDKLDDCPRISATQAKQAFGEMLDRLREEPTLAITSHGRIKALISTPQAWSAQRGADTSAREAIDAMERKLARARQSALEAERLQRHAELAIDLLNAAPERQQALIGQARDMVRKWRDDHLVSADYIERWERLLDLPVGQMARELVGDCDGWGRALRQNTPFVLAPR